MAPRHLYLTMTAPDRPGNLTLQSTFVVFVLALAAFGVIEAPGRPASIVEPDQLAAAAATPN